MRTGTASLGPDLHCEDEELEPNNEKELSCLQAHI